MQRHIAQPARLDLDSPGRRDYWVAIEHDTMWGAHFVPLTVIVGPDAAAHPERGLVAFGATHGNEYEGPVAIKQLLHEIRTEDVLGRMILVPVLNAAAFRIGQRDSMEDDRVNLNRAFVDNAGVAPLGGATHRIAQFVREFIWPRVHVSIDLHAGGHLAQFALCVGVQAIGTPEQTRQSIAAARWFGTPLVTCSTFQADTPGLLNMDALRQGKISLGGEFGWGTAVNPFGVRCARHGILATAIHHGQMRGSIEPHAHHADGTQKVVSIGGTGITHAPWPGLFEPLVECGAWVRHGQPIAHLHDFHHIDSPPLVLTADCDGFVMSLAWNASVRQGQIVGVIASEIDPENG